MKKKFGFIIVFMLCILLVGCGSKKEKEDLASAKLDLDNENLLVCTNIAFNILHKSEEKVVETWKYAIDYEDDKTTVKNWREIYGVDYSNAAVTLDDAKIEEEKKLITDNFCKGRVNDVTAGKYEDNKDLCKVNYDNKVFTAVVTYPSYTIEMVNTQKMTMDKLKSELDGGTYDGGFRGVYSCDKNYDSTKIGSYKITGKEFVLEYNGDYLEDAGEGTANTMNRTALELAQNFLKTYKVDITDNVNIVLIKQNGNKFTYRMDFTCRTNDNKDCQTMHDQMMKRIFQSFEWEFSSTKVISK